MRTRFATYKSLPQPLLAELRRRFGAACFEWIGAAIVRASLPPIQILTE